MEHRTVTVDGVPIPVYGETQVLVVGRKQTAQVHPKAIYATAADAPRWNEGDLALPGSAGKTCPACGRELP